MTVCYFGIYNPQYPRNRNIIEGLKRSGVTVLEVNDRQGGLTKYLRLFRKHWQVRHSYDYMIVGFAGQIMMPFARLLTRKPVILDLHVSLFDSDVIERKKCSPRSLTAGYLYFLDWWSCRLARRVLLDTRAHVRYMAELLHLPESRFIVVYHGVDTQRYKPLIRRKKDATLIVEFHGFITPTNGMELVIEAMRKLAGEDIALWVIGGGSGYARIQKLAEDLRLDSVHFYPYMPPQQLMEKIADADVGLGFFSTSGRVKRVIANKVCELMALRIPVLTADSEAMREQFTHGEHVFVCRAGDADAIAESIRTLKSSADLRQRLADHAYVHVREHLVPEVLGKKLIAELQQL